MRLVLALALGAALSLAGCTSGFLQDRFSGPGDAAKALLDPRIHPKLLIEIDHPVGSAPDAEAKSVLKSALSEVTGRPGSSITFLEEASIPSEPNKKYTLNEIVALEREHRDRHSQGDTAVLYVLYVAGGYEGDDGNARVLGITYRGTSIAMFKGNVRAGASGGGVFGIGGVEERCIERAVLTHEFGHAAGLVNLGAPMVRDHEDPEHKGHSSNKDSVMYYAVENTVDLLAFFTGGCSDIPYRFDDNDKADLRALRDR